MIVVHRGYTAFFFNKLNVQQYESLSHVIKCILVHFYGQSQVEQGFNFNKALMNDNIQEKSVIARCSVKNYMQTYQLEPHKVKITKYIKKSVRFAREHYHAWLEEKKDITWLKISKREKMKMLRKQNCKTCKIRLRKPTVN